MSVSEEAIVAGAKAMDAYWGGRYAPDEVEELRGEVTAMLEAAAPHMLAEAYSLGWRDGTGNPTPVDIETGKLLPGGKEPDYNPYKETP